MANIAQEISIELDKRELLELDAREEYLLGCESGELWITFDGRAEDLIVRAGERISLRGDSGTAISALRPARLTLAPRNPRLQPRILPAAEAASRLARRLRWRFSLLAAIPVTRLR